MRRIRDVFSFTGTLRSVVCYRVTVVIYEVYSVSFALCTAGFQETAVYVAVSSFLNRALCLKLSDIWQYSKRALSLS